MTWKLLDTPTDELDERELELLQHKLHLKLVAVRKQLRRIDEEKRGPQAPWPPATVALLRYLWSETSVSSGLFPNLFGCTRCAAMGKLSRMGLLRTPRGSGKPPFSITTPLTPEKINYWVESLLLGDQGDPKEKLRRPSKAS